MAVRESLDDLGPSAEIDAGASRDENSGRSSRPRPRRQARASATEVRPQTLIHTRPRVDRTFRLAPSLVSAALNLASGWTPTRRSTSLPPWKKRTVGIAEIRRLPGVSGFSSVSILPILTLPWNSSASFSIVGASMRQGPHQGAQKSTTTGVLRLEHFRLPVGVGKLQHVPGHGCVSSRRFRRIVETTFQT